MSDTTSTNGWIYKRLEECTSDGVISYGIVQPGSHCDEGVPVLRVNNITNGALTLDDVLKVAPEIEVKYKRTRLKGGEVLLTLVGSTGQSLVVPNEMKGWNVPRAIAVIRVDENIGANWVNICLQSSHTKHFLDVRANTTVQKTLNLKDVKDIPILLPPKPVREFIENTEQGFSKKIALNENINKGLEQIAQAIFKSWFIDFEPTKAKIVAREALLAENPAATPGQIATAEQQAAIQAIAGAGDIIPTEQLHAIADLFPSRFVESELGEIPEGWKVNKVENIITRLKPRQRFTKKQVEPHGKVPVFEQGAGVLLGYQNGAAGFEASPERPMIIFGDHTCITHLSCEPFDISSNVIPLEGRNYPTLWVFQAVKDLQQFQEYRRHWSEFIIKKVVTPDLLLTELFSKLTTTLVKMKEATVAENSSLIQIRDRLLPKLLSGELEVSDA